MSKSIDTTATIRDLISACEAAIKQFEIDSQHGFVSKGLAQIKCEIALEKANKFNVGQYPTSRYQG